MRVRATVKVFSKGDSSQGMPYYAVLSSDGYSPAEVSDLEIRKQAIRNALEQAMIGCNPEHWRYSISVEQINE